MGTIPAVGLKQFEQRLERLVEGAFTKAFRSGLEPVEIGRRIVRAMDENREVGVRGVLVPNAFTVWVSPDDQEHLSGHAQALIREYEEYAREHARDEGYRFVGRVSVEFEVDEGMRKGELVIDADISDEGGAPVGSIVLPDGERVSLGEEPAVIGRLESCDVTVDDPKVSRRHAEVRPHLDGFRIADLGSTNGTQVNGETVVDHPLEDGDRITVGDTPLRFESS